VTNQARSERHGVNLPETQEPAEWAGSCVFAADAEAYRFFFGFFCSFFIDLPFDIRSPSAGFVPVFYLSAVRLLLVALDH
jgi:hypothetical protein